MSKLSYDVIIAGRTYPLTISEGEQAKVKKASEEINKMITILQNNYAVKDKQDLLAMTALQLATRSVTSAVVAPVVEVADYSEIESKLNEALKVLAELK